MLSHSRRWAATTTPVSTSSAIPVDRRGWRRFASLLGLVPLVVMSIVGVRHSQQSEDERPSRPAPVVRIGDAPDPSFSQPSRPPSSPRPTPSSGAHET